MEVVPGLHRIVPAVGVAVIAVGWFKVITVVAVARVASLTVTVYVPVKTDEKVFPD
jgi:hypothetical protein